MPKNKKDKKETFDYGSLIMMLLLLVIIIICVGRFGLLGIFVTNFFNFLTGPYYLITLMSIFILLFVKVFLDKKVSFNKWFYIGFIFLNFAFFLLGAHQIYKTYTDYSLTQIKDVFVQITNLTKLGADYGGGLIGMLLLLACYNLIAKEGTLILIIFLFVVAAILIIPIGFYASFIKYMKDTSDKAINGIKHIKDDKKKGKKPTRIEDELKKKQKKQKPKNVPWIIEDIKVDKQDKNEPAKEQVTENKETEISKTTYTSNSNYKLPPLSLLDNTQNKLNKTNKISAELKGNKLIEVLGNFGVEAQLDKTYIGPSVIKFEVKPDYSINLNKITSLQNNLKMELAAKSIRIEAPVPGKSVVGVEIPNAVASPVKIGELVNNIPQEKINNKLLFALGKDVTGQPVFCEINKMPHLLIAGATGSGKSVCINTIICSLLLRCKPEEVRLVLVDPKMVEFAPYHDLPHLLWPVITDSMKASNILSRLTVIMDDRYRDFMEASVKNIESYNSYVNDYNRFLKEGDKPKERMPYIVVIIDELADLMAVAKNDVQVSIQRFTAKARACGMHLIVATQRPSTDVITGLIKSNIPSRISFAVVSQIDSRTILDQKGAETLLGNGDMLYVPQGLDPTRIQGAYVSEKEIANITDYVKKQAKPEYDDYYYSLENLNNNEGSFAFSAEGGNTKDPLYDECIEFIKSSKKASTSVLQRRFGIGYNRAARIIDQLEENGLIGPSNGSKPREIYIQDDE